jgi:hypothetical protein
LIPREVLFGNRQYLKPQISPDGQKLAWIGPDEHRVLNVWVRGSHQPASAARLLTNEAKRGVHDFFWQADSRHLIYLQDKDGDENWQLRQVATEGGSGGFRPLTPENAQARVLKVSSEYPNQIIVALNHRDARFHDAYRLELTSGKLELLTQNPGDVEYFVADNRMEVRAAFAQLDDGSAEIRVRDTATSRWRTLTGWGADEVEVAILGFTTDNNSLWYLHRG